MSAILEGTSFLTKVLDAVYLKPREEKRYQLGKKVSDKGITDF